MGPAHRHFVVGLAAIALATVSLLGCPGGGGSCVQSVLVSFPFLGATGVCCPGANPIVSPLACTLICIPGRADCDGDLNVTNVNGCETNLTNDNANCGRCGRACGVCDACNGGTCLPLPLPVTLPAGAPCPQPCGECFVGFVGAKFFDLQCGPKTSPNNPNQKVCCAPVATSCNKDADCCAGCCLNGTCAAGLPQGAVCASNNDCCGGSTGATACTKRCSDKIGVCTPSSCGVEGNNCPSPFTCCTNLTGHKCVGTTCACP